MVSLFDSLQFIFKIRQLKRTKEGVSIILKICLVRHGETEWNSEGILQGKTDIPLNDLGIQQAEECADYLSQFQWDVVITSPLKRAKQTAEIINKKINVSY